MRERLLDVLALDGTEDGFEQHVIDARDLRPRIVHEGKPARRQHAGGGR